VGESRGARIRRNLIRGNDVGVGVTGGAAPAVEENDIAGCVFGIVVSDAGSDPLVASNAIAGCRSAGILVDGAAGGVYEGNGVTGPGAAGIRVEGAGTFARLLGNRVTGWTRTAVRIAGGAGAECRANDLRDNPGGAWQLDGAGDVRRTGNLEGEAAGPGGPEPADPGSQTSLDVPLTTSDPAPD
jgi:nitrous oxidase accessory protein NosD